MRFKLSVFYPIFIIICRVSSRSILGENNKLLATVKYNQSHEYYDENKMTVYREIRDCPDTNLYPSISLSCSNFGKNNQFLRSFLLNTIYTIHFILQSYLMVKYQKVKPSRILYSLAIITINYLFKSHNSM